MGILACSNFNLISTKKEFLEISGKYLIAFCMFYAVLQNTIDTYLNGDFFYFTLLTDMRFGFLEIYQYDLSFLVSENLRTLDMMK